MPGSTGWPTMALYDPTTFAGMTALGFGHVRFGLMPQAANDPCHIEIEPPPVRPPPTLRSV